MQFDIAICENFSSDNSEKICIDLGRKFCNVFAVNCLLKGTSQARKKGVLQSSGDYILFMDQDDKYKDRFAVEKMVRAIMEDGTQVVQFGHYARRFKYLLKKIPIIDENRIFVKEDIRHRFLGGVIGINNCFFNTAVWNKIFDAELLKKSVLNITQELYFAEDSFLNFNVFINDDFQKASCQTDCFYTWTYGVGFSSSASGSLSLMKDYDIIKPIINKKLKEIEMDEKLIFDYNVESVYFYRAVILKYLHENICKDEILNTIRWINSLDYIIDAKKYLRNIENKNMIWDELKFLINESDINTIYNYFVSKK